MRFRWSLRSFFIAITIFAMLLAWRYNERNKLLQATKEVRARGGEVAFRWQKPVVQTVTQTVIPAYRRSIEYTVTLPDGSTEIRRREHGYTVWIPIQVQQVQSLNKTQQTGSFAHLWGAYDDIAVDAITVSEECVDNDLIDTLTRLNGLKLVVVLRNREYYRLSVCGWEKSQHRADRLKQLDAKFQTTVSLLTSRLPNIAVVAGIQS